MKRLLVLLAIVSTTAFAKCETIPSNDARPHELGSGYSIVISDYVSDSATVTIVGSRNSYPVVLREGQARIVSDYITATWTGSNLKLCLRD